MEHGKRRTYAAGCRCVKCARANREYGIEYRRRRAERSGFASVSSLPASEPEDVEPGGEGSVLAGVAREIEGLELAELRPGLAATALSLARVLDDPRATNQKPAASKALMEVLSALHKGSDVRRSRLASVRSMTSKTG